MNLDKALAHGIGAVGRAKGNQLAALTLNSKQRMSDQTHVEPAVCDLAHDRIDQERHIVVDDLDHRDGFAVTRSSEWHCLATDFRRARCPVGDKIVGPLCHYSEIVRAIAHDVLRHGTGIELGR